MFESSTMMIMMVNPSFSDDGVDLDASSTAREESSGYVTAENDQFETAHGPKQH